MPPLYELKQELEKCKLDLLLYHNLLEKREIELKKVHALKESVEAKLTTLHRLSTINQTKAEDLKKLIAVEMEQIDTLKKFIKNIDSEIDQLGDEKEEVFEQLKKRLILAIHEEHPDSLEEYQALEGQLDDVRRLQEQLLEQKKLIRPFFEELKEGSQIKLESRFFDFLFGKNPKAQLGRTLQRAAKSAEQIMPKVHNDRLKQFLNEFLHETQKIWNKDLYRGKFSELFEKASILKRELDQEIDQKEQKKVALEKSFEQWIEKHSTKQL